MMTTYIALLRGINVGGKNMIKMDKLRRVFEAAGFLEVQTYIQSGNVLFQSGEGEDALRGKIEQLIERNFGFAVPVILRTSAELENILLNCPFSEEKITAAQAKTDAEILYVALLSIIPPKDRADCLDLYRSEGDEYEIRGRDVFLLFQHSIRNSKLANNLFKLDSSATVRNWKTICKLAELAKAMDN